jgi:hypothetical protein
MAAPVRMLAAPRERAPGSRHSPPCPPFTTASKGTALRAALTVVLLGLLTAASRVPAEAAVAQAPATRLVVVVDGIAAPRNFPVLVAEKLG